MTDESSGPDRRVPPPLPPRGREGDARPVPPPLPAKADPPPLPSKAGDSPPPTTSTSPATRGKGRLALAVAALAMVAVMVVVWLRRPGGSVAAEMGTVVVDATPWGEVVGIVEVGGNDVLLPSDAVTPLVLRLAPGEYEVSLAHPQQSEPVSCRVEVVARGDHQCTVELGSLSARGYFREVGWWR